MTAPAQDEERVHNTPTSAERIPTPLLPCPFCGAPATVLSGLPSEGEVIGCASGCNVEAGRVAWQKRALAQRAEPAQPPPAAGGDDERVHHAHLQRMYDEACDTGDFTAMSAVAAIALSALQARAARSDAGDALCTTSRFPARSSA